MGSGGGTFTQTTESEPWGPLGEQLQFGYGQSRDLYGTPMERFPGSHVAGRSSMSLEGEQAGLGLIRGAGQGQQMGYLNNVLSGQYLTPGGGNPYIQQMGDQMASDITQDFKTSVFPNASLGSARAGSGFEMNREGRAYGQLASALAQNRMNLYGQNYNMERGFQQQAPGLMQNVMAGQRANIGMGHQLGGSADRYAQNQLGDIINRFNFSQNEPGQRLDDFMRRVQGGGMIPGTETTTGTQPSAPFTAAQGVGAGLGLLGLISGWGS